MLGPSSDCPLSPCIGLLAGAWTLEILYFVGTGPKHFGELRRALRDISSKVLSRRLRELEERGVLTRTPQATYPVTVRYELTDTGRELTAVLDAMVAVSRKLKQGTEPPAEPLAPPADALAQA